MLFKRGIQTYLISPKFEEIFTDTSVTIDKSVSAKYFTSDIKFSSQISVTITTEILGY